jgi:hypothetical protein
MQHKVKWFVVEEDKFPSYTGFVWIRRNNNHVRLAYFNKNTDFLFNRFQLPETAGDNEGLLTTEYFTDVTHWAKLEEPEFS